MRNRIKTVDLNSVELFYNENLKDFIIPDCQAGFFDLSSLFYLYNFDKNRLLLFLRNFESILQKKQCPVFAFLRQDLLGNEILYTLHKAVIISDIDRNNSSPEERFAEPNGIYPASILTKPGSGKLELDDRFEFTIQEGFKNKINGRNQTKGSDSHSELSVSNINFASIEAKILVEDSDRDSEDEMEADSNF